MSELKPCRKCGKTPTLIWWFIKGVANRRHYRVWCDDCREIITEREYNRPHKAINAWNRRVE